MFIRIFLLSIILMAIIMVFMGIKILFRKNGKFPDTSIGGNKELRKLGITCPKTEEIRCYKGMKKGDFTACAGCSVLDKIAG